MANTIDNAIARLQDIVQSCTDVPFKSFPDYPIENADPFPMSIGYIAGGSFMFANATMHKNFPTLRLELHFSRVNLKQAYQQIDAIALEFPRRLASDPTLNGTVETVISTQDSHVSYIVVPFSFGRVMSQMLQFDIPVKTLQSPL